MSGRAAVKEWDSAASSVPSSVPEFLPGTRIEDRRAVEEFVRDHPAAASALAAAPEVAECFGRDAAVTIRVVADREEGDTRLSLRIKTPDGPRADRERLSAFRDRIAARPACHESDDLLTFGVAFA